VSDGYGGGLLSRYSLPSVWRPGVDAVATSDTRGEAKPARTIAEYAAGSKLNSGEGRALRSYLAPVPSHGLTV
jgi:hypothetical protein